MVQFFNVVYSKKSGSRKFRVAAYLNEHFGCNDYRVEQYKKGGWLPVGNLRSFNEKDAVKMLESRF